MSSNEKMVSFPRELSDELAELIATKARVCGGGADEIWEAICEGFGKSDDQPQGEPVALPERMEPHSHLAQQRDWKWGEGWNAYRDEIAKLGPLYTRPVQGEPVAYMTSSWVGKALYFPSKNIEIMQGDQPLYTHPAPAVQQEPVAVLYKNGAVLTKADCGSVFDVCCKVETPLYTHADPTEVERLASANTEFARRHLDQVAEVERLRRLLEQSEKTIDRIHCMYGKRLLDLTGQPQTVLIPDEEFVKYFEELKILRAQLAERDALLREVLAYDKAQRVGEGYNLSSLLWRIQSALESEN